MKKSLLLAASVGMFATLAFAQTATVDFTQSAVNVSPGDTFTVTFQLQTGINPTLNDISSFDLFLESNSANVDNNFSITQATNYPGPGTQAVPGQTYPQVISTSTSDHSGYAQNNDSQGFNFNPDVAASNPTNLVTLTIKVGAGTPTGQSYTFFNTSSTDTKATFIGGGPDTSDDLNFYSVNQASFTIDVVAVPEPSTWLAGAGALGVIGYSLLRRRATA